MPRGLSRRCEGETLPRVPLAGKRGGPPVNLRRTYAVARKELLHILRDPMSLGMAVALPVFLLFLFGYALTLDVDHVRLAVWDQSATPASRDFVARFQGSRYFTVAARAADYREIERGLDTGKILGALVIPRDFAGRVEAGRPVEVQLVLDGSDSNTAAIAGAYAEVVVQGYSREVVLKTARRAGRAPPPLPLELRPRVWFNTELESKNYIVPGLTAVVISVIAALLTSLTVAREWERGTMEQLISTPVKGPELVLGKLAPYLVIGMLDVLTAVLMGEFLFHIPLRGSVVLLFFCSGLFVSGALSMGILISVVTKNQMQANQLAMLTTFMPSFLLSGFIYAIRNAPGPVQALTLLVPARYFIAILRAIYLKGVGLDVLAPDVALLAGFCALMMGLAASKFKKRLD